MSRAPRPKKLAVSTSLPGPLSEVSIEGHPRRSTGLRELDRVLGRSSDGEGLAAGQVLVLGGAPGVGKSTLLMQALGGLCADGGGRALYASGEETRAQIAARAHRLGLRSILERVDVLDTHDVAEVARALERGCYATAVADSLQTFTAADLGDAGTTRTVAAVAERLTQVAKANDVGLWLIGQATKDGRLAGPNAAAHVVDTLLWFDREQAADLRVLRASKNRYGSVGEVGIFRMDGRGLHDVVDAGRPLVRRSAARRAAGAVWAIVCDEDRPIAVEVQALVGEPGEGKQRVASGVDAQRLSLVLAVLARHGDLAIEADVFVDVHATAARLSDRGLDLPLALAIASAARGEPIAEGLVCCGKLSLTGEVLPPWRLDARLSEMRRLGFQRVLVPPCEEPSPEAAFVETLREALAAGVAS